MDQIQQLIIQALASTLNIDDPTKINLSDNLKENLGLDSMTSLSFLMKLEETIDGFIIDADTLDGDALISVSSITEYVTNQLKKC